MGMSAFPSFMTQATPATQPLINAEPAVAAQTEQNPQVGQVMPGVQGADAPVVAQNGPSRDVKLTFAQIAPPPGSMVLRGINPNGSIEFGMRSGDEGDAQPRIHPIAIVTACPVAVKGLSQ